MTDNILLRNVTEADLPIFFEHQLDPQATRMAAFHTRALSAFLEQVKTRPLYAHVAKHKLASMRVLEKCGFTIIGEDTGLPSDPGEQIEEFILKLDANDQDEVRS